MVACGGRLTKRRFEFSSVLRVSMSEFGGADFGLVHSPISWAQQFGIDFFELAKSDAVHAGFEMERLVAEAQKIIQTAQSSTGMVYRLAGADHQSLTPMQYGGLALQHDLALVSALPSELPRVVLLSGQGEFYLDLLASLECDAFLLPPGDEASICTVNWVDSDGNVSGQERFSLRLHEH